MSVNEQKQILEYNKAQAKELESINEKVVEQIENTKSLGFAFDKVSKLQAQYLENLVRQAELTDSMSDTMRAYADISAQVNRTQSDFIQLRESGLTRVASLARDLQERKEAEVKLEKELADLLTDQNKALEETATARDKILHINLDIEEVERQILELEKKGTEEHEEQISALMEKMVLLEEQRTEEEGILAEQEKQSEQLETQIGLIKQIKKANKEAQDTFKKGLFFKGIEKAGAGVGKFADAYGKVQGIGAEMYKATGGMTSLMDNVQETFSAQGALDLADYGIGFEGISEAMVNLSRRSGEFATASSEVQAEVGLTTAKLARLGVTAETSAELFNTLRLNFGFSADQFGEMADTFVGRASDIGMSVEQYTSDFQASYPVLSRYGTDAVNVFDKLARQARASGLSVQELASNMDQFNTFQGAAENASKLNFLLGSQLDTTQLLMADEAERLDMIKGAFSPAQFQNMDKFKKKAIAAAAGFSDVSAFEKAMRGDADKLGDLAKTQQEKLDDATRKSTSEVEAFGQAATNIADQMALSVMPKLSESLGDGATGLYGVSKAASIGLTNLSGMLQIGSAALAMFNSRLASGGGGGVVDGAVDMVDGPDGGKSGGKKGFKGAKGKMLSKVLGSVGKMGKGLKVGGLIGAGIGAVGLAGKAMSGQEITGADGGEAIGSAAGGAIGAALGSVIPGLGTMVGGMVGSYAGAALGKMAGSMWDEKSKSDKEKDKKTDRLIELQEESNKINERTAKAQEKQEQWNKDKKNFAHVVRGIDSSKGIRGS